MTTKITWTHVDAHVRRACETAGMLPIGFTDAEVAHNYLKYLESKVVLLQREGEKLERERDWLKASLRALEAKPARVGKTKQRSAALEKAVAELQSRGFGEKLLQEWPVDLPKGVAYADPFGPRDADGWYTWNGDDTMRPAGRVEFVCRDGEAMGAISSQVLRWTHENEKDDILKWRPAQ